MLIALAVQILDRLFPLEMQQAYDSCGFQCGRPSLELKGIMVGLDITEEMILEAEQRGCNLLLTHHPLLFHPLRRLGEETRVEQLVHSLLERGMTAYAAHTNLDAMPNGVNGVLADEWGLSNRQPLEPLKASLMQLVVYVPVEHVETVRDALFAAGAGGFGKYNEASFGVQGSGTFKPLEGANPYLGSVNSRETIDEIRLEVVLEQWKVHQVLDALKRAHPYEEVAYQLFALEQSAPSYGLGMAGDLPKPMSFQELLELWSGTLGCSLRYSLNSVVNATILSYPITRIGFCAGAGADLWTKAKAAGAQAYLTSEIKHHHFLDAADHLLLVEAGHAETEIPVIERIKAIIQPFFNTFAVLQTCSLQNPALYFPSRNQNHGS
jgi:dinuclear metal center YbgI/SA1388 family protein